MLKRLFASLIILLFVGGNSVSLSALPGQGGSQVTESEAQEAQDIAVQFTSRFAETKDLTPIVKELYFNDFIERYIKSRAKNPDFDSAPHLYFLPGLEYDSRLLTEGNAADWQRFYLAANNFLLFGFVSGMKKASDNAREIKPTDLYPRGVIELLDKNPHLAKMIVRKGPSRPVNSVEAMQRATATFEQANGILRQEFGSKSLLKIDSEELAKLMKEDEFFKLKLDVLNAEFFGFPKGTRILIMKTPLGLQLMLTKDSDKLKIFWTDIMAD